MNTIDIITKKRDGQELSEAEIKWLVNSYTKGEIPDYQMSSFLMAVYYMGMTLEETTALTLTMASSGKMINLSSVPGTKMDKHSTGGVGDTTTLVLAPLSASAGVPVAKMSGRALGVTGGTIDKLESIPGFQTELSQERFIDLLAKNNLAITGQTPDIAPADGKIYALRDASATVESIPLIASSVMSKKIAAGADKILLDVKVGSGAFLKKMDDAQKLAETMVSIGKLAGRPTVAAITNMDMPLGRAVGNSLEIKEAIALLSGKRLNPAGFSEGQEPLLEVCLALGSQMMVMAGAASNLPEGKKRLAELIANGKALAKFKEFVASQGGDPRIVENPSLLPQARFGQTIENRECGYIEKIDAGLIGALTMKLGAGRQYKGQPIDLSAGVLIHCLVGEFVEKGQPLFSMFSSNEAKFREAAKWALSIIGKAVILQEQPVPRPALIYKIIE